MALKTIVGQAEAQELNDNFSYLDTEMLKKDELPYIRVKDYGTVGDGIVDDIIAIQQAIDYAHSIGGGVVLLDRLHYISTSIILKENAHLKGYFTIIDIKSNDIIPIKTETPTLIQLTQTNDINVGDIDNLINNSLSAGDFIAYRSSDRFTEDWDEGAAIRPYYTKGEIFKISQATSSSITFTEGASLKLPSATSIQVEAYTPNKNISIEDIAIKRDLESTKASKNVSIDYCDFVHIKNVKSFGTNAAGIATNKSRNIYVDGYEVQGNSPDLQLNYGLSINDGTKNVFVKNIRGDSCRHVVAGGGTGYAIPMNVYVDGIVATNSQSHALDTHGNTMNFNYMNAMIDTGFSTSGRNHTLDRIYSTNGRVQFYEGGTDIDLNNLLFAACERLYSDKITHRVKIRNSDINMRNITTNALTKLRSTDVKLDNVVIRNADFENATDAESADASLNGQGVGFVLREGFELLNSTIEGFATGFFLANKNSKVENVKLINCGWESSTVSYDCAFLLNKDSEGSYINNLEISYNKSNVPLGNSRILRAESNGVGSGKNISICNVRHGKEHSIDWYYGSNITNAFTDMFLQNIRLNATNNNIQASGKFIFNTIVADN